MDILNEIQKIGTGIDTITCEFGLNDILYKSLNLCKDSHIGFAGDYPYEDKDSATIVSAKEATYRLYQNYLKEYDVAYKPFQIYYVDGSYYVPEIYDDKDSIIIPKKSQLLKVNGMSINKYMDEWVLPVSDRVMWDDIHKQYYTGNLFAPQRIGEGNYFTVTYVFQGDTIEKNIETYRISFPKMQGIRNPNITYITRDKTLYIRVPAMNHEWINDYKQVISTFKGYDFDKVIIDIRRNTGGSDLVWKNILASIIDKPIIYNQRLAFRNNSLVKEYLRKSGINYSLEEVEKEPLIIGNDTMFILNNEVAIEPLENSLKYGGNIYVLVDDKCFSSALAFYAVCQFTDVLVSVGQNSGYFGGQGITPFYFMLPNSKYIFRVDCSLDASSVSPADYYGYYHNKAEIPVSITLDDILKEREYQDEFYSEDFLYNIDVVFKEVLKLP